MAEKEKKEAAVEKKTDSKPAPAKKNKVPFTQKVGKFFREYKSELKKVVWATPQQTLNNTILVAVSVVITSVCIGVLDFAFSTGLTALGKLI
ncbi:MAG: preprotein translocase subunit SecE [Clostridiales bacterium]|nr:preprotein translocase subunit SecE [Clostridiales bacterium]